MKNNDDVKKIEIVQIEKPKIKEKNTRVITKESKWKYNNLTYEEEIRILTDLKNKIKNEDTNLLKSEIKKKLSGYKNQDIIKKKYDEDKFISYENTIKKLIDCGSKCLYCNGESKIFYKYVRDTSQWSLDRVDNNYGHNYDNVEISCLKCNLRRKTITTEKYILTKQIMNIKKI